MINLKLDSEDKAYGAYLLLERGYAETSSAGIFIPHSASDVSYSFVLSVGPLCTGGAKPGDFVTYQQGIDLKKKGPNGGKLFAAAESQIATIIPGGDKAWPRDMTKLEKQIQELKDKNGGAKENRV